MSERAIFVTGAARGIGRATARRFARGGWRVGLFDVDEDGVRALAAELGPERCHAAHLDVTDGPAASDALERFAVGSGGRLDVLFNNAGLLFTGPFEDIPPEQNAAMIAVNLTALVNLTRAAFPWLRDTPDARVISMSSASSTYGVPELAVYSATKHAVRALTEALEIEWAPHGIRVCDVVPPYVDTPMISGPAGYAAWRPWAWSSPPSRWPGRSGKPPTEKASTGPSAAPTRFSTHSRA